MRKEGAILVKCFFILFSIIAIISFSPFISGDFIFENSTGGDTFFVNEGEVSTVNFSINNTFSDSEVKNISIELSLSDIEFKGGEGSSAGYNFYNETTDDHNILNWNSSENFLIENNSKEYFWIEVNTTSKGGSELKIRNSSGGETSSSLSFDFNDSTENYSENAEMNVISPEEGKHYDREEIWVNATADPEPSGWGIETGGDSTNSINESFNFSEGERRVTIAAIESEDDYLEKNVSFFVDTSDPVMQINSPTNMVYQRNEVWFNFSSNEEIDEWLVEINSNSEENEDYEYEGENQSFSGGEENFSEVLEVPFGGWELDVYALDSAGNVGSDSILFNINSSLTDENSSDNDSENDSSWTNTYEEDDVDLSKKDEIVKNYTEGERIKIKVIDVLYFFGITEISERGVSVNVSEVEGDFVEQKTQGVGERKEYDLDDDGEGEVVFIINEIKEDEVEATIHAVYSFDTEEVVEEDNETQNESQEESEQPEEKEDSAVGTVFLIIVGGIFVISLIGIIYYVYQNQQDEVARKKQKSIYKDPKDLVGQG